LLGPVGGRATGGGCHGFGVGRRQVVHAAQDRPELLAAVSEESLDVATKGRYSASGHRGPADSRTTAESTSGWGQNTVGGTIRNTSTSNSERITTAATP